MREQPLSRLESYVPRSIYLSNRVPELEEAISYSDLGRKVFRLSWPSGLPAGVSLSDAEAEQIGRQAWREKRTEAERRKSFETYDAFRLEKTFFGSMAESGLTLAEGPVFWLDKRLELEPGLGYEGTTADTWMNATLGLFEEQRKLAREYYAVDPEFAESYAGKVAGAVGSAVPQLVAMRVPIAAVVGIGGQSFLHAWEDAENTAMRRGEKFDPNRAYAYATTMAALNTALTFLEFKMVLGPWKKGQSELLGDNLIKLFQSATAAGAVNSAQGGVNDFGATAFGIEFRNPLDLERRWDDFTVGAGAGIVLGAGARMALANIPETPTQRPPLNPGITFVDSLGKQEVPVPREESSFARQKEGAVADGDPAEREHGVAESVSAAIEIERLERHVKGLAENNIVSSIELAREVDKYYEYTNEPEPTNDPYSRGVSLVRAWSDRRTDFSGDGESKRGEPRSEWVEASSLETQSLDQKGVSFYWTEVGGALRRRSFRVQQLVENTVSDLVQRGEFSNDYSLSEEFIRRLAGKDAFREGSVAELRDLIPMCRSTAFMRLGLFDRGAESDVYWDQKVVYKLIPIRAGVAGEAYVPKPLKLSKKGKLEFGVDSGKPYSVIEFLRRVARNNAQGSLVPMEWIGVTTDGKLVFIQPSVAARSTETGEREGILTNLGLVPVPGTDNQAAIAKLDGRYVIFSDLHGDNVLVDEKGNGSIIDAFSRYATDEEILILKQVGLRFEEEK